VTDLALKSLQRLQSEYEDYTKEQEDKLEELTSPLSIASVLTLSNSASVDDLKV
jgi:hypothetical protein